MLKTLPLKLQYTLIILLLPILLPICLISGLWLSIQKTRRIAKNKKNWREKNLSFEERAKEHFELVFQVYKNMGSTKCPVTQIRDLGSVACPSCHVENALLLIQYFKSVSTSPEELREGIESHPNLSCFCSACNQPAA